MDVFRLTLEISKQVFPVLLDIDNPAFLRGLRKVQRLAVGIDQAKGKGLLARIRGVFMTVQIVATLIGLYFLPTKDNTLPERARLSPAW
jgi:magnesium-protoporphyrin IX monomethyl ester (oxidative) cyclase